MNEKLFNSLNKNIADIHILYVKLHNYHWNVKGPQFYNLHKMTEEFYDHFAVVYDDVAERVLQLGGKPPASVKGYLDNAEIKEEIGDSFNANQVVNGVIHDFGILRKNFGDILEHAEKENDVATANIASDEVQWLEKSIWLLKSTL